MGKWLDKDGLIDLKTRIKTKVDTKVDKYTEESAGKFLQTDSNGNAVWGTAASPSAVAEATEQWLDDHVSGGSTIAVDDSLTVEGAAADAKATGALVKSAATQPTDSTNRLWINESSETEYQVPTQAEFDDLKSALSSIDNIILNYQEGYKLASDGSLVPSSDFCISDYFEVTPSQQMTVTAGTYNEARYILIYDSSKNRIDSWAVLANNSARTFTVNAGAKYARFTFVKGYNAAAVQNSQFLWQAEANEGLVSKVKLLETNATQYKGQLAENADLNDLGINTVYFKTFTAVQHGPSYVTSGTSAFIYTMGADNGVYLQLFYTVKASANKVYIRRHTSSGWGDWEDSISLYSGELSTSDDVDNLEIEKFYYKGNISVTHSPTNNGAIFFTMGEYPGVALQYCFEAIAEYGKIYCRRKLSSGWGDWYDVKNPYVGILSSNADLDSLIDGGTIYFKPEGTYINSPTTKSGLVIQLGNLKTYVGGQLLITTSATGNEVYYRRKINAGFGNWEKLAGGTISSTKSISILFVGNSLTQDGIAYLPYLLSNYFPEISFKFYMWYNGGYTLVEQYTAFNNNTPAAIFSVAENSASWTNYNGTKTMSSILSSYTFDVVCLQGYYNYTTNTDDETAYNNCRNYIQENYTGNNPLEFISLFHAPKRDDAATIFERTKLYNGRILQNTISQDMIPIGIAVYRALSTDLDSLGDEGHLSPDGTHTQEGLPCLLQTYTALCWLLDKLAISKSVYGFPFKMTTAIYNTINVPGPNLGTGVIEGTDAQNLLAQEVAIKAYKEGKSFVNKNIYVESST